MACYELVSRPARAFTLIELLVVIAIIALLAAILFPVFARAREKARQITCVSNAKQFMLGILQYAQDSDEAMPISYAVPNSVGPYAAQVLGVQTTGVPAEIMPYVKSTDLFHCPDDNGGMAANGDKNVLNPTGAAGMPDAGHTYAEVIGTSYKFTHQNFSNPFPNPSPGYTATGYQIEGTDTGGKGTDIDYSSSGRPLTAAEITAQKITPTSAESPVPTATGILPVVRLNDFARPTQTRIYADFPKVFMDKPLGAGKVGFHPNGTTIAYADGHAKFIVKQTDYLSGCDGVDWAWGNVGSCNPEGYQRLKD